MNEELRQDSIVRFCEALTARIRTAIKVMGPKCVGYGDEFLHNPDHNIIRVKMRKLQSNQWLYNFTDDRGESYDIYSQTDEVESYLANQFRLAVFEGSEPLVNGDIHFSKKEIDWHPSGLSSTINPWLQNNLINIKNAEEFNTTLTEKMKWYVQVNRKEWSPASPLQRGFDKGLKLESIVARKGTHGNVADVVRWLFVWSDGTVLNAVEERCPKLYRRLTKALFGEEVKLNWQMCFNRISVEI